MGIVLAILSSLSSLAAMPACAQISAVWANSGEDKVTRDELRATPGTGNPLNRCWDGKTISIFGARNEVVSFNLILETVQGESGVSVTFRSLRGPAGTAIESIPTKGDAVFDWSSRNIELFYVRYLQIRGLSLIANPTYDERLVPARFRRPWATNWLGKARGRGSWSDRPDHDKHYPEIAVPLELHPQFDIAPRSNQSVWVDVYIPKGSAPGVYSGRIMVRGKRTPSFAIPVRLQVHGFSLPDTPSAKTMVVINGENIDRRYFGVRHHDARQASRIRDRYFMVAHRHRVSLIGDKPGTDCADPGDRPCPDWLARLDGSLFTPANGYSGPGMSTGNNVYSIGTYGFWSWKDGQRPDMWSHADRWVRWFSDHSPSTEYFLYLADESKDYSRIERWAGWIRSNPGPGQRLKSLATLPLPTALRETPSLDIPASTMELGRRSEWESSARRCAADTRRRFFMYNGHRPGSGSFAIEDDGVALRELAWGQFKKHIDRWFYWESTYYSDPQGRAGDTDLFSQARTYGGKPTTETPNVLGETSSTYGNGDGVLFYPGTDKVFPTHSYGVSGPFASLRLKLWRRGIQDADYLTMASAKDPAAVQQIVDKMVPKVLWEYGVRNPLDPTYQYTDVSWPTDPDRWDEARERLSRIIEGTGPGTRPTK